MKHFFYQKVSALIFTGLMALGLILPIEALDSTPTVGKRTLKARFTNIEKVVVGTPVMFAGKVIGAVAAIQIIAENIEKKITHEGEIYPFELLLLIDNSLPIYDVDEVAIINAGSLERPNKAINIAPMPLQQGKAATLIANQDLYGRSNPSFEGALQEIANTAPLFKFVLESIQENDLVDKITRGAESMGNIARALDDPDAWAMFVQNLGHFFEQLANSWKQVDQSFSNIAAMTEKMRRGEGTLGQLIGNDHFYKVFYAALFNGNEIASRIVEGKGFIGKMMRDEFYLKSDLLINKIDVILNDINHYGVLFHLNKNWQRLRARRLNLLQQLRTPQEFRNYFNDELSQIFTGVHRVTMALEMTENACLPVDNCEVHKLMSQLLLQVNALQEEVRSYHFQTFDPPYCLPP